MASGDLDEVETPRLQHPSPATDAGRRTCSDVSMIEDEDIREAFTALYASALKRPHRAGIYDQPRPHDPLANIKARDAAAQRRQDLGLDKPRQPRPVIKYIDPPANEMALKRILDDYRYFFGEVKYIDTAQMARMRLPIVVWQHIFSSTKKRMELDFDSIKEPGKYCLHAAKRERAYVNFK